MAERYYIDSCIWIDYFENRSDRFRPLGDWAFDLIKKVIDDEDLILYSELVEEELGENYSAEEIEKIFSIVPSELFVKVNIIDKQIKESINLFKKFNIPKKDALHAILARDNNAIFVTRDKHFYEIYKKLTIKKPEELI